MLPVGPQKVTESCQGVFGQKKWVPRKVTKKTA